ncbi:hypothetical protein M422DRAFT_231883 [Sphaerobolus stellatus SS14]|uniref:Unplaced genomic scaffold SPHSTscaffold_94, whole genome shotgun sequence n=1 Tax=Sphaerobolus stellatus (strain SS14) TaxID=990650 RepID=A0A0C9URP0_SPHS4|nr:hypothetical protein M422DRAFT_231883 [Sphaerobolus stellatus SS14]
MSFANAPVSKGIMMGLGAASLLVSLFDIKPYFHLQLVPHISRHHQYWRLLSSHLACTSSSSLLLMELVLYGTSITVERQFGSVKYASFITVSALLSSTLSFLSLLLFHRIGIDALPSGPIAILFSALYQYHRLVPPAYTFQIFSVKLSNNSFIYILAWQLIATQFPGSLVAALVGILTGQLYRADVFGLKSYRLPRGLQNFGRIYILPMIGSLRPPRRSNQAMPEDISQQPEVLEPITTARPPQEAAGNRRTSAETAGPAAGSGSSVMGQWVNELTGQAAAAGIRVPTEAEINQLVNMFPDIPRESIVLALRRSPDIEHAVETLLGSAR